MKQLIFTPEFAEWLKFHVEENLSKYQNSSFSWRAFAKEREGLYETDIEQPDLTGMLAYAGSRTSADDFEAGKILFEAFKDLTPMQAAQSHFWQYLSHVDLYEYMRKRWSKVNEQECDPNYIAEHWFYKQNRNWLEGLYWSFKNTVQINEDGSLDYTYTNFLFKEQNLRNRGIMPSATVFRNHEALKGVLQFCIEELDKKERGEDTVFDKFLEYRITGQRGVVQLINKLAGVIEASAYTSQDFYNFLVASRDIIKSQGDRKKEKKERDEAMAAAGIAPKKKKKHKKNKKRKKR